ncbi:LysM peptidoglycan-binding domain-containing protein, partial [Aliivibrio sifiae]|uniref:LysM peptidoglycan-binding domain-containing protein n=1 Tax=Aliivibrio sifiae TaxID=566293 RepID=UPI003D0DC50C
TDDLYFGAGLNLSSLINSNNSDEQLGLHVKAGYDMTPVFYLESSLGYYGKYNESEYLGIDLSALAKSSLSNKFDFFAGLGSSYSDSTMSPIARFGLIFKDNQDFDVEFGYKFNFRTNDSTYDIQSLLLSFNYRFGKKSQKPSRPIIEEKDKVVVVDKTLEKKVCDNQYFIYKIKEGDWLYKIAKMYEYDIYDLLSIPGNEKYNEINKVRNWNLIYPGEEILLPTKCGNNANYNR